ncbi:MAG TPA: CaiB/BaiF CoA-transferase family protein [Anaeromyxobacteraceae bacterium]|nr:CaiB/BaiF CoA-transferase family protein [Anaeromyxobacteraceae bacterium]
MPARSHPGGEDPGALGFPGGAGALSHLRVLDLSRVLAGPWATQVLADLGAEVIKVERPGTGDESRAWGPPFLRDARGEETGESAYFLSANRGKKSIAVDLSRPEGQAIVRRLAQRADVLVENFKVGALDRLGLGFAALSAANPRLVYCSISGFGQTGPYRDRAGYDFLVQGMGGLMSVTGEPDGAPGGGPMKVGVAVADVLTGMYAATAVLAALAWRDRTGRGQRVDLSLLDVQVATLANQAQSALVTGRPPARMGNAHPSIVPYQAFAAMDGHLVLAVGNDAQFARFCEVAGLPELARDPRFATNAARVRNREDLVARLAPVLSARPAGDWIRALEAAGVPCGPINDLAQVFDDPQVRARGMRVEVPHPLAGAVPLVASPLRLSDTPPRHGTPPLLGQHTREVLIEALGMDPAEVEALRERGVVGVAPAKEDA